jgi:hypothetical protein
MYWGPSRAVGRVSADGVTHARASSKKKSNALLWSSRFLFSSFPRPRPRPQPRLHRCRSPLAPPSKPCVPPPAAPRARRRASLLTRPARTPSSLLAPQLRQRPLVLLPLRYVLHDGVTLHILKASIVDSWSQDARLCGHEGGGLRARRLAAGQAPGLLQERHSRSHRLWLARPRPGPQRP